jgi:hypothetical protein
MFTYEIPILNRIATGRLDIRPKRKKINPQLLATLAKFITPRDE